MEIRSSKFRSRYFNQDDQYNEDLRKFLIERRNKLKKRKRKKEKSARLRSTSSSIASSLDEEDDKFSSKAARSRRKKRRESKQESSGINRVLLIDNARAPPASRRFDPLTGGYIIDPNPSTQATDPYYDRLAPRANLISPGYVAYGPRTPPSRYPQNAPPLQSPIVRLNNGGAPTIPVPRVTIPVGGNYYASPMVLR